MMPDRQFARPYSRRKRRVVKVTETIHVRQSKRMAMLETVVSTVVGLAVALAAQVTLFKAMGIPVSLHQNVVVVLVMTVLSIARGYGLRRAFNWYHGRQ